MTRSQKTCPRCGTTYDAASSPAGVCPSCLMENALGGSQDQPSAAKPGPTPEELASAFPDYEFMEAIGWGGMGNVYRARQKKLDRTVAIKLLRPDLEHDPAFAERFEREARALAQLEHPGVVRIYDFGETDHGFFLSMEYVDGANLRELLRDGKLTSKDALSFVPQICDALQFAHDKGIVHRDIKPENILVDQNGRVRIADFGLAKLVGSDRHSIGLTGSSHTVGTPHYMAPEQVAGSSDLDHRADIYSLGVVLYEMLTGELPIGRFNPPSSKASDGAFDEIVMRTLESEPEKRYQDLRELKRALAAIPDGAQRPTAAPQPPQRDATPAARSRTPSAERPVVGGWCIALVVLIGCVSNWGHLPPQSHSWGNGLMPGERAVVNGLSLTAWNTNYSPLGFMPIPGWFLLLFAVVLATTMSLDHAKVQVPRALATACGAMGLVMSGHLLTGLLLAEEITVGIGLPIVVLAFLSWSIYEFRIIRARRGRKKSHRRDRQRAARKRRFSA